MVRRPVEVGCEGARIQGRGSDVQVWGWLPARPELPVPHSQEEIEIFADERDLRRRKLMIRCGFYARGECKFEGCCARSLRIAAAPKGSADSTLTRTTSQQVPTVALTTAAQVDCAAGAWWGQGRG